MSDNKTIAKNTIFLYFRMFLIMGISLYTSRITLNVLGEDNFGIYNVVGGIVLMFTFLNGALAASTSRFITYEIGRKNDIQLNKVFNVSLITHISIAIIIFILSETIGLWFLYNKMIIPAERLDAAFWVYQISIATCMLSITQVPYSAAIIAHERMSIYAYVGIVEAVCKLGIVYLITVSSYDKLIIFALLVFLLQLLTMLFYRFYANIHFKECKLKFIIEWKMYKQMFVYAGSDMIGNIAVLAQGQGLNLLLNIFFGTAVNAARGIAYQVQGVVTQFSSNFLTAVRPQIIKLYAAGKINEMFNLVIQSSCFSYYLMLIIIVPICIEAEYVLTIWLGEYPNYTVSFLRLVLVLCMIQTIKAPRTTVFHATGKILIPNIFIGTILCMTLPVAYLVLRLGGDPNSVFWTAIASISVSEIAGVIILKLTVINNVKDYIYKVYIRCIIVTIISLILPLTLYQYTTLSGFMRCITTCLITTFSIISTVYFIGIDKSIRKKIIQFAKNRLK